MTGTTTTLIVAPVSQVSVRRSDCFKRVQMTSSFWNGQIASEAPGETILTPVRPAIFPRFSTPTRSSRIRLDSYLLGER